MNKKKMLMSLGVGGLIIAAPIVGVFAADMLTEDLNKSERPVKFHKGFNVIDGSLLDEPNYELGVKLLERKVEHRIRQANLILENIDVDEEVIEELNQAISEYVELEIFLDSINTKEAESEYLKEIFLEYKEQVTVLTNEFRTLIRSELTEDQIVELKETFREHSGGPKHKCGHRPMFTSETLKMVDSDLAEAYANGELTKKEVMEKVKEIMDSMTDEEREESRKVFFQSHIMERENIMQEKKST